MGKSDPIIFLEYYEMTRHLKPTSIAFLGFSGSNAYTDTFECVDKQFFDISLGNWDINSDWSLGRKFDLVVSTRCPYFARDPAAFVTKCKEHGGRVFLDWGLGDHWRFKIFKTGWVRFGEHEYAYKDDNFLHSCLWRSEFHDDPTVRQFWASVTDNNHFGYAKGIDINTVVRREVPAIVDYEFESIRFRFLWPESPQLYIMTLV